MNDFIAMLKKIKPNVDFENEDALVDDGILESLDIITIIAEIADKYDVIIPSDEITSDKYVPIVKSIAGNRMPSKNDRSAVRQRRCQTMRAFLL